MTKKLVWWYMEATYGTMQYNAAWSQTLCPRNKRKLFKL